MTDLLAALADIQPDPFLDQSEPETPDEVFATHGDTYQRFNAAWHQARRESKEGSP